MGYDLHITRQQSWIDEDDSKKISLEEWKTYLASDPEMKLENYAESITPDNQTIRNESEGLSIWTAYSKNGVDDNYAWFNYNNGEIVVKNPDDEIIGKMIDIAGKLNAKVQGDDDEIYHQAPNGKIKIINLDEELPTSDIKDNKPWWKIW